MCVEEVRAEVLLAAVGEDDDDAPRLDLFGDLKCGVHGRPAAHPDEDPAASDEAVTDILI